MRFTPAGTLLLNKRAIAPAPLLTTLRRLGRTADPGGEAGGVASHLPGTRRQRCRAWPCFRRAAGARAHAGPAARPATRRRQGAWRRASYRDQLDVSLGERPMLAAPMGCRHRQRQRAAVRRPSAAGAGRPVPGAAAAAGLGRGGGLGGWIRALDAALGLPWDPRWAPPGPLVDRTAVQALRQRLQAARQPRPRPSASKASTRKPWRPTWCSRAAWARLDGLQHGGRTAR